MSDGTVYSFGYNFYRQLGNGNAINQTSPVKMLKGIYGGTTYLGDNSDNPIISISASNSHTMSIATDGFVFNLGYNNNGQLGDSTLADKSSPMLIHGVGDLGYLNVLGLTETYLCENCSCESHYIYICQFKCLGGCELFKYHREF